MGIYDSVVITGGGGMLAHALAADLRGCGVAPALVGRAECDISRPDEVAQLFQRYRPTLLLNCAAHTKVDLCEHDSTNAYAVNGNGPGYLAEQCKIARTRFTHFSTDFVFDGQSDRPYLPNDQPSPLSVYGASKLLGEKRILEVAPDGWLIVRTAWLYGGHGHCFPKTILKVANFGTPLTVVDDQFGSPTFANDLSAATLTLINKNALGLFHVTNSGITSWYDFAGRVLEVFGVKSELRPVSTEAWTQSRPKQAKRPRFSGLNCSDAIAILGRPMRGWHDALREYRALADLKAS